MLPGALRAYVLRSLPLERTVAAAFAGPPSVAHTEALLRGVELRAVTLDRELDAVCIGVPRTTPYLPRERPNPLLGSYLGLGLALRLWRDSFPVAEGGTAILLHRFHRHFSRSSLTAPSSPRRGVPDGRMPQPSATPSGAPQRTRVHCWRIATGERAIRCCRSWTGTAAARPSAASATS
jgi:hypothetical protein